MTAATAAAIEHVIGTTGAFALHVRSHDVRLIGVDGDTARVRTRDGDLRRLDVQRGDGVLSVRAGGGVDDLEVEVPRDAAIVVESSSGDVTARGLRGEGRYRTSSGDIQLDRVAGRLTAEAVSGDVRIVAADRVEISARTVSGDLSLQAGTIASMRAVTTSGDLRIAGSFEGDGPFTIQTVSGDAMVAPAGGLLVTVSTITGDIRTDVEARQDGPRGQRRVIVGSGAPALAFSSTSGDLRIGKAVPLPVAPPQPPVAPTPPLPPTPPTLVEDAPMSTTDSATDPADVVADVVPDDPEIEILRALERGEIDVPEATRRLAALTADPDGSEAGHVG